MKVVEALNEVVPLMAPKHVTPWTWTSFFSHGIRVVVVERRV
jgi:hypothetical protein